MANRAAYFVFLLSLFLALPVLASDWYLMSSDHRTCFKRDTPAERISELQQGAENIKTNDLKNGGVEVGYYDSDYTFHYQTYFPSKEQCNAALPINQPIPDKYR